MRPTERVLVYALLAAALLTALAAAARPAEPPEAKVATCDIYGIADRLMKSEKFEPTIKEEFEKIRVALEPMEKELQEIQQRGETMKPEDPGAGDLIREFQEKSQAYGRRRQELETNYQRFLAAKYVEAYDLVKNSVDAVAQDLGYTHVIASRKRDEKIQSENIQRVIEAVLARPVLKAPDDADITDDVSKDLKLD
ncbi:MAG TPA: OmpH family outer membrane protein [Phycisphaerales bacterium]|nr:OmpH family outer membrane protein [Phycisphaerales bacterium]